MLEFPSWLQWLGDVIGMEWPQGNEDDMWAMSGDWKSASGQLNEVLGMIDGAKSATLDAYPSGDGRDAMIKSFDELRTGDKSLEALAKAFGDVGEMVYQGGTEIEYTKLMFYSMLTITAVDIAAVWIFPPTAPAEEAAIIAGARFAAGQLLKRAIAKMLEYAGELGAKALMKFLLKHIALNAALAGFQDFAIQEYQVLAGHRHGGINWDQLAMTTFAGGVGGAAGGAFGEAAGRKLGNLFTHEAENFGSKFVQNGAKFAVGAGSGAINAGGAFAASTGWQFVETWSQQGWDKAVAGLEDTKVPWGMIAAGGVMGGAGSLNHSFAESHFENSPKWQNRVPDTPNIGDVGGGFNLRGHGGDQAGAPVVDGSVEHSGAGTGGHGPASSSEPGGFEPVGQTGNQHGSTGPAGSGSEGVHQYSPDQQSGSVEHAVPESGLDTTGHDVGVGAGTSGHDVGLGSGTSGSGHDVGVGSGATGHDAGLGPGEHDSSAAAAAPPPSASTGATAAGSDTPAASSGTSGGASPIDARSPAAGGSEVRGTELRPVDSGRAASDIGRGAADPSRAGAAGTVNRAGAVDASSRGAVESGRGGVEGAGTRPTEASRIQAGAGESQTSGDTGRTGNAKAESVGARAGTESARPGADRSGAGARPGDRAEPGTQRRTGGDSGSDTKSRAGAGEGSGHAEEPRNSEDSARTAEREEPGSDPLVPEENAARPRGDDPESSGAARSDDSEAPSGTRNSEEPSETPHDDVNDESRSRDSGSAGEQRDELADTDFGRDRQGTDSEGARPQEDIERVHTEEVSGGVRGREGTGGGRALEDAGGGREQDNTVGVRRQDDTGTRGQDDTGTRGQDDTGTRGQDDTGTRGQDDTAGGRGRDDTEHAGAQDDTKHAGAQGEPEHTRERDGTEHPRDRGGTEAAREKDTEGAYEHEHARTSPRRAVYPNVDGAVDKPPRDSAGDRSERTGHGPRPEDFPLPPVPAAYSGGDHVRATPAHESGTASSPVGEHPAVEEVSKRGRCAELALRLVKELTGSPVIEDLKRVVGLDGVTAEELQGAAGGRMLRVSGHDEIVRRLMKLRDGACAIVVDSYHAGPDEHGVGAHAYVMVKEGDDIVVRDRSIDPADDPVRLPTDVRESHVILFDHTGRPRHPLSRAERTALSESGRHRLMAVRIGESLDDDIGRMHEVLGGTPTGDRILRRLAAGDYHDYIEHGPHSDGRSGAFGRSTLRATLFGDNMTPVQRALALAHESVHAERFVDGESALDRVRQLPRREFVRSMVHEEALATARRFDLANELRGRGHRIINHPLEVEYQRAYDRARGEYRGPDADVHDYARARAVAALETKFGEVANDHGVTYNDLYGEHWDRAQAKQVESAGARHIPDDPRVRQDLAAAALRRHQADVKVENLAGELDSLARRLSDRIPYDHAMGRERARSLIDEQLRSVDEELGRSDASAGGRPGLRRLAHDLRRMSDLLDEHHNALAESDRARIPETAAAARELLTGMAADHAGARPVGDHFLLIPGEPDRVVFAAGPGEHARLTESAPPEVADALAHSEIEYVEVSADPGGEVRYRGVENPDTDREQPRTAEPGRELVRRFSEAQFEKLRNISSRTDIGDWAMRTLDELGVDYRHDSSADRYEPGRNRLTVDIGGTDAEQMAALV
ncbi:MAG: hypothetical protein J2P18_11810, partial [Nocardia sp.]|nr:hypothetical protein [Nocardia sp.]